MGIKKLLSRPNTWVVWTVLALSLGWLGYSVWGPNERVELAQNDIFKGEVVRIISEEKIEAVGGARTNIEQELMVAITLDGQEREVKVLNDFVPVEKGDEVLIQASGVGSPDESFHVVDIVRLNALWMLVLIFVLLILLVSGKKGFNALVGLVFSFVVIFSYIIPAILKGWDPVTVGLTGALIILIVSFYVSHGFNYKSLAAIAGIGITLLIVGIFSSYIVGQFHFSGFSGEESVFLNYDTSNTLSLVGILIAGIIIAAIGVLDDVAITQSAIVFSLGGANKELKGWSLFRQAMDVGRDHISAVINTLVLAYTGAALPLLLLLYLNKFPIGFVINGELVAEEIVRTLISSSGLILAVPITTFIAVLLQSKVKAHSEDHSFHHHH